jgi:hypothetical protein
LAFIELNQRDPSTAVRSERPRAWAVGRSRENGSAVIGRNTLPAVFPDKALDPRRNSMSVVGLFLLAVAVVVAMVVRVSCICCACLSLRVIVALLWVGGSDCAGNRSDLNS